MSVNLLGDINPQDPNQVKKILDRLDALEKQVREMPDQLPPQPGQASATRRGLMSKEQAAKLDATPTITSIAAPLTLTGGVLDVAIWRQPLNVIFSADQSAAAGSPIAATTWTNLCADQAFNTLAGSLTLIGVRGACLGVNVASQPQIASRILIDGATPVLIGGDSSKASGVGNFLAGAGVVPLVLAAGNHTVRVQIYSQLAGTYFCRPATQSNYESLAITIEEWLA